MEPTNLPNSDFPSSFVFRNYQIRKSSGTYTWPFLFLSSSSIDANPVRCFINLHYRTKGSLASPIIKLRPVSRSLGYYFHRSSVRNLHQRLPAWSTSNVHFANLTRGVSVSRWRHFSRHQAELVFATIQQHLNGISLSAVRLMRTLMSGCAEVIERDYARIRSSATIICILQMPIATSSSVERRSQPIL